MTLRKAHGTPTAEVTAALALADEVAAMPLPEAWGRLQEVSEVCLGLVVTVASDHEHDAVDRLLTAHQRCIDTLVSRRLAELGGLH
jgi:hypothetical protein